KDSSVMVVARVTVRPVSQVTLGASGARYSPDSTRYGYEASVEERGIVARGEVIGQHEHGRARDDLGWFALLGYRVLPWLQLVAKQEDFQRPGIAQARRMSGTTGAANLDLGSGRTRLTLEYVSRTQGFPRVRKASVISQLQVRF